MKGKDEVMGIGWMDFVNGFQKAMRDKDFSDLDVVLDDIFMWHSSGLNKPATREWALTTDMRIGDGTVFYESDEILVGRHSVTVDGETFEVFGVAHVNSNRVYSSHHLRAPSAA